MSAAADAYYVALQSGDLAQVQAAASARCGAVLTSAMVKLAAAQFAGLPATVTVLSIGTETASVNIDNDATPGNDGTGSQFRLEEGRWVWDGCP